MQEELKRAYIVALCSYIIPLHFSYCPDRDVGKYAHAASSSSWLFFFRHSEKFQKYHKVTRHLRSFQFAAAWSTMQKHAFFCVLPVSKKKTTCGIMIFQEYKIWSFPQTPSLKGSVENFIINRRKSTCHIRVNLQMSPCSINHLVKRHWNEVFPCNSSDVNIFR